MKDLSQWLFYLENRHTVEVKLRLFNVQNMLKKLQFSGFNCPVITVTGTNGKGSTVAALEQIYVSAGYRVGAYTSPHLIDFNERIRLDKKPIDDLSLCELFEFINQFPEGKLLTYFEMATLAALLYFKQSNCQVIILEVGVGGRLDATNCISADLAIITTIDLDHQDYLGDTRESIGFEKSGIMRPGGFFIYADTNPPLTVIEQSKLNQVIACYFKQDYEYFEPNCGEKYWKVRIGEKTYTLPYPNIHPKAAAAALIATDLLRERVPVVYEQWIYALENMAIKGRQQVIERDGVIYLLDVAHNPQAATHLSIKLKSLIAEQINPGKQVHAVFSILSNKDIEGVVSPIEPNVNIWYPILLEGKRATTQSKLDAFFAGYKYYSSPVAAFKAVNNAVKAGDIVVVYGSFYVVGPILKCMGVCV